MRFNTIFDNLAVAYFFGPPCLSLLVCLIPSDNIIIMLFKVFKLLQFDETFNIVAFGSIII